MKGNSYLRNFTSSSGFIHYNLAVCDSIQHNSQQSFCRYQKYLARPNLPEESAVLSPLS